MCSSAIAHQCDDVLCNDCEQKRLDGLERDRQQRQSRLSQSGESQGHQAASSPAADQPSQEASNDQRQNPSKPPKADTICLKECKLKNKKNIDYIRCGLCAEWHHQGRAVLQSGRHYHGQRDHHAYHRAGPQQARYTADYRPAGQTPTARNTVPPSHMRHPQQQSSQPSYRQYPHRAPGLTYAHAAQKSKNDPGLCIYCGEDNQRHGSTDMAVLLPVLFVTLMVIKSNFVAINRGTAKKVRHP